MYLEYFGLEAQPFRLTPDPHFLYLGPGHARAKAYMDYSVWNRDSFVVITGEVGSGKTTLIQNLLRDIDDNIVVAKVHQTQLNELEFFQAVLVEFGFRPFNAGKVELLDTLNTFLIDQYNKGKQVVLIIDEAQNLSPRVMEEVRLLTGLETATEKLLNLIMAGQPELKELLDAPGMEQLNQRIRFRFHLKALSERETGEYIQHRMAVAGWKREPLIPDAVIPMIRRYSGGIPRLINTLCDTILISAFVDRRRDVDEALVEEAIEELQWVPFSERSRKHFSSVPEALEYANQDQGRLVIHKHDNKIVEVPLDKECLTLGRLPGNDIMVDEAVVSGHHAKIITIHGTSFLEDLNSTNGTFVNAERIRKCVLRDGDVISLARCRITYVSGGARGGDTLGSHVVERQDEPPRKTVNGAGGD